MVDFIATAQKRFRISVFALFLCAICYRIFYFATAPFDFQRVNVKHNSVTAAAATLGPKLKKFFWLTGQADRSFSEKLKRKRVIRG